MSDIIIAAVIAGVFTIVGMFVKYFLDLRKSKTAIKPTTHVFKQVTQIYDIMSKVCRETSATRFLILKTTNGGGIPRVGAHLYASVIYEVCELPLGPVKADYQNIVVDHEYVSLLIKANSTSKGYRFFVKDTPEGSLLRQIYETEGVCYSEVYALAESSKSFYYCSVATHKTEEDFSKPSDRLVITLAIDKISQILKQTVKE